jgi:hypothetical protein
VIAALLMAAAAPQTAVEAERAFAARAQEAGQWKAFAEFATDDAMMFVPEPVRAKEWLAKQPEEKQAVAWSASASYVSCDGDTAVNTGPWWQAGAKLDGFFTTVWIKGEAGWRWTYDGGAPLKTPRAKVAEPVVERASCEAPPISNTPPVRPGVKHGGGSSRDGSLIWGWSVEANGARHFKAQIWTGDRFRTVVEDVVPAAK